MQVQVQQGVCCACGVLDSLQYVFEDVREDVAVDEAVAGIRAQQIQGVQATMVHAGHFIIVDSTLLACCSVN